MAAQHTPGPWLIGNEDATGGVPFIQIETDTQAICEVSSTLLDEDVDFQITDEDRANARLIAAAPDLLIAGKHLAVKLAEAYRAAGANPAKCQAVRDWMDTVAKAEGRA